MKHFYLVLSLVILAMIPTSVLRASHAMGVDITYTCISNGQYEFTLTFYRDCDGISAPSSVTLNVNSANCNFNGSFTLTRQGNGVEVSPLCPSQINQSTCNGGTLPGVEQYIYKGIYTFPQECSDWSVSFQHCCRNSMITNLNGASSYDIYVETTINNINGLCNSSPTFTSLPVPYICTGQQFCYNHGAVDPEGDSLVYSLVNALTGPYPGGNIPYNAPYSPTYPIGDINGQIQFDSQTGSMCVTPNGQQVSVVTILVEEYRNGVLIGSTMRDLQIVVRNCTNQQPTMTNNGIYNQSGGVSIDSNSVQVCPGEALSFNLQFQDPNPMDTVTVTTNLAASIPGANFSVSGTNPATGTFTWTPGVGDVGLHSFTVTVQDNGCPVLGSQVYSFDIEVIQSTSAGPDKYYCPAGGPVQLQAVGGTQFTWTPATGLSCTNCANPTASPSATTTYIVQSNLASACKNKDTVTVFVVPDFNLSAGPADTICKYGQAQLNATAGPGTYAPYSWLWTPGATLSSDTISNPLASPLSTTEYILTATSSAGCIMKDTVTVVVDGVAPQVEAIPEDTICLGDSVQMDVIVYPDCGTTTWPCTGPSATGTAGTSTSSSTIYSPLYMSTTTPYSVRKQYIYTQQELDAMGFTGGGKITAIALDFSTANSTGMNLVIKMGCYGQNEFLNGSFVSGLQVVKNTFNHTPSTGWNVFTLDNPYMWDGQSSIIVEFCSALPQLGTSSSVRYTYMPNYQTIYLNYADSLGACNYPSGIRSKSRPNMQFTFCKANNPAFTYNWTPSSGLSSATIRNPKASPSTTTTYQVSVSDGQCLGMDDVTLTTAPGFAIDAGPDTTICKNFQYQMSASAPSSGGPYTYQWVPGGSLSDSTILNPVATPMMTTTYYLFVTAPSGCTEVDTMTVFVNGVAPNVIAGVNTTICPDDTVQLFAVGTPECGPSNVPCTGPMLSDTVGTYSGNSYTYFPYYVSTGGYTWRKQYIYTAAELNAMGFTGGARIDAIGMIITTAGSPVQDVTIKMGCVGYEIFPDGTYEPGLMTVRPSAPLVPVAGLNMIPLTNPYYWDGSSNLIVEFCTNVPSVGLSHSYVEYTYTSPDYRTIYKNLSGTGMCSEPTGYRSYYRPRMVFQGCLATHPGYTYSWSPAAGLSNPNIANPEASPTQSTSYVVTVEDGYGCTGQAIVQVNIDSANWVVASADNYMLCPGDSTQLHAQLNGTPPWAVVNSCGSQPGGCNSNYTSPDVYVGNSTYSSSTGPFAGYYDDYKCQMLYHASELNASGGPGFVITSIGFEVRTKYSTKPYANYTVKIGCTSATEVTTASWIGGLTTVYGPKSYSTTTGWNDLVLDVPYAWDGQSNLVVEICWDSTQYMGGNDYVYYTSSNPYYSFCRAYSTNGNSVGCSFPSPTYRYRYRHNTRFGICRDTAAVTYTWTPATGLNNPNSLDPIAKPTTTTTYVITVSGTACEVKDSVTIDMNCVLATNLLDFTGEAAGERVRLDWLMEDEAGLVRYQVEKLRDGQFVTIGTVPVANRKQYTWFDPQPEKGSNLYRLAMKDQQGNTKHSEVAEVVFLPNEMLEIYPNPTNGNVLNIVLNAKEEQAVSVRISTPDGRVAEGWLYRAESGGNEFKLDVSHVPQGIYILEVIAGETRSVEKLVITR